MSNKRNVSKEHKGLIMLSILILVFIFVLIPIGLEKYIFGNTVQSNITNGEWPSFFGSFLGGNIGAIITAMGTIIGIKLTIDHNTKMINKAYEDNQRIEDEKEKKRNLPYFIVEYRGSGSGKRNMYFIENIESINEIESNRIIMKNIGMNTALGVKCLVNKSDDDLNVKESDMFESKRIFCVDEVVEINFGFNKNDISKDMVIEFEDLMKNKYTQKVKISLIVNDKLEFDIERPVLII